MEELTETVGSIPNNGLDGLQYLKNKRQQNFLLIVRNV